MTFNVIGFLLGQQLSAREGITDTSRQTFYGLLGGILGSRPVGLGVTLVLARQEAERTQPQPLSAPTLGAIDPNAAPQNSSTKVQLTGSNFVQGAEITVDNSGIVVDRVTVVDPAHITAVFTIASNAPAGATEVNVTTPGGTSSVAFTVNAAGGSGFN